MGFFSEYSRDLVVGGIGIIGGLVIAALSGVLKRLWEWWDSSESLRKQSARYQQLINLAPTEEEISKVLIELREWIRSDNRLLEKASLMQFYEKWLNDEDLQRFNHHSRLVSGPWVTILDGQVHADEDSRASAEFERIRQALAELKKDAETLLKS